MEKPNKVEKPPVSFNETLRRMLATPPDPHKTPKSIKPKPKKKPA